MNLSFHHLKSEHFHFSIVQVVRDVLEGIVIERLCQRDRSVENKSNDQKNLTLFKCGRVVLCVLSRTSKYTTSNPGCQAFSRPTTGLEMALSPLPCLLFNVNNVASRSCDVAHTVKPVILRARTMPGLGTLFLSEEPGSLTFFFPSSAEVLHLAKTSHFDRTQRRASITV